MANYDNQRGYNPQNKIKFTIENIDKFVIDHGSFTIWEKSYLCPCRNKETTSAKQNCPRCSGTGFSHYDAQPTLVLYQAQEKGISNGDVAISHTGTSIGTTSKEDKITFRDRLTVSESLIPQSLMVLVSKQSVQSGIYLRYQVEEVTYACTDEGDILLDDIDIRDNFYYPSEDLIGKYVSLNLMVMLRYYVVDILREARYQYQQDPRINNKGARVNQYFSLPRKLLLRREDMYIPSIISDADVDADLTIDPKLPLDSGLGGFFGG